MPRYISASTFGWLDFDERAAERADEIIKAWTEPETVDALGLGTIRDTIANVLTPGTSTVQTRLRYFFFIPWIMQGLEKQRIPPSDFAQRLRDDEIRLIDCLRHHGPREGVIGYTAGRNLRRLPSSIYWNGLESWKFRWLNLSIDEYGRRAAALGEAVDQNEVSIIGHGQPTMWAVLPEEPSRFLDEPISFDLTEDEAWTVVHHLQQWHPHSALAEATRFLDEALEADWPWDLPKKKLSSELKESLHHAQCFSELTAGPQDIYNLLLARKAKHDLSRDTSELQDRIMGRLDEWVDLIKARHSTLREWSNDIDAFWTYLNRYNRITEPTRLFTTSLVSLVTNDPRAAIANEQLHTLIREREAAIKGNRARLTSRLALENWNGQEFGGQFDYRWATAWRYLDDIHWALSEPDDESN